MVAVGKDPATRHVAGHRPLPHRVRRPLPGLLAFKLIGERRDGQHELVGRRLQGALAVLEIEEDPHARRDDLLERVGRLDGFAPEAGLLAHHGPAVGPLEAAGTPWEKVLEVRPAPTTPETTPSPHPPPHTPP